jgi:hypothetical protein
MQSRKVNSGDRLPSEGMDETLRPGETLGLYFVVAGIDRIHSQSHRPVFRLDPGNLAVSLRWDKAKLNGGIDLWKPGKHNES